METSLLDKKSRRLWKEFGELVGKLPLDDAFIPGRKPLIQSEVFSAESYLYGRLVFQVSQRLVRYVEEQELGKVREAWGELIANLGYLDELLLAAAEQERGEEIIEELFAIELRRTGGLHGVSKLNSIKQVTIERVDPMLIALIGKSPDLLKTLDWRTFEKLLATLLKKIGYEIDLQRGTKDGGIDIFALKRDGVFGTHRYLVQAKRWTNEVQVGTVREVLFLHSHHRVTRSCLATTSRFSRGAWKLARDYSWQLELRDFDALKQWVELCRA